jgi:FtsP/CotA-like multicopper oxidase with cupredoxin domain
MNDRRMAWLVPLTGFFVVIAFGVGLISMAAFGNAGAPAVPAGDGGQVVNVELGDLFIKPAMIHAEPGTVTFRIHNGGATEHNFSLGDLGATAMLPSGSSAELSVDLAEGTYPFQCDVSGHAGGGMTGSVMVGAAADAPAVMTAEEMRDEDAARTATFPAKTEGLGGADLKPRIGADGTRIFELTAAPIRWEVEPGIVKDGYAYNGMIPGPTIRAHLGDRVRIVLSNLLSEPTLIHFHGMTVPNAMDGVPAITQDAVLPGHSFTYEFTIRNTGTNMYHSHFMAQRQVPMGLLGAFIVADPNDPKSDADVPMVLNDGPLGFTLNGKSFPATAPIAVKRGQILRIRYMNEGLLVHPMHLHGMAQQVIALDGHLLDRPYIQDTVMVAPGQRVDVLVSATEPGAWAFHCHILSHAEGDHGMFGMVTAVIVE